jgi:ABC-type nitrate/sulfonate/bicarbonate transport system substrate-binding protein
MSKKNLIAIVVIAVVVIGVIFWYIYKQNAEKNIDELVLADASVTWWMGPGIIAQMDSLYKKNGLLVKSYDVQTGLASKNAVVAKTADIGLVATTPLALGAFTKENLVVLCSYMESNSMLSLLTPYSSDTALFSKPEAPVAVVKGTISELYYFNYMKKYYPDIQALNQLNVRPADVVNALKGGNSKSAVIWEPFATILAEQIPGLKRNTSQEIYTHRMYIVTRPEVLAEKRTAVKKFIKSFEQANELLNTDPEKKKILVSVFPLQETSMNNLWNDVHFSIKFDYENMIDLMMKDATITYQLGQTPKDKAGNLRQLNIDDLKHYFDNNFKNEYVSAK